MTIQYLPNPTTTLLEDSIQIIDYQVTNARLKSKLILTKNVISFLIEGTKEVITHNASITITSEQFLLVKSGNCLVSENVSIINNYRSILLFFSDEVLLQFMNKNKISVTTSNPSKPYHVCDYDTYIQHYVTSLQKIQLYESSLQKSLLQTKFEEIMIYLIHKKGKEFLENFFVVQNNYVRRFKNIVESNILNNLTIQELAFLCNMSISTFKREFVKNYQTTPIRWFQEKRLEHSVFLLNTKKLRPVDVFHEVGFESLSSFTQAFKQKYGNTPKQFQLNKMNL